MRVDIEFDAEGATLRGWLYLPDEARTPAPCVVMAHGFSAVKEQGLDKFGAVFAAAGLGALVFDNRNFGASDGEPRQEIDPWQQVRDYRHAISYAQTLDAVDATRIGIWGTSSSGGRVLAVAAFDRRVACVVSMVPAVGDAGAVHRRLQPELTAAELARFDADRAARFAGEPPAMIPVVAADEGAPCALPGRDCWAFFEASQARAPAWRNEVTLRSVELGREFEPGIYMASISPTPLLMIVGSHDALTPTDQALAAFERALQPKRLVLLPGGHFEPYAALFEQASAAARDWFLEHLRPHAR